MHEFPKLLEDVSQNNRLELNTILTSGLPWLRLKIPVPHFSDETIHEAIEQSTNWRDKWQDVESNYQVREWNGSLLFGPEDFAEFSEHVRNDDQYGHSDDYDRMCMINRQRFKFGWRINEDHPIRKFVNSIFPNDADINIVNYFTSPPGGYLFPHLDPTSSEKSLNKLYVPLKWSEGNEFGFYRWGNMPVEEGNAYLINNYSHVHWVVNRSNQDRVVLAIGANLSKIENLIKDSFLWPWK